MRVDENSMDVLGCSTVTWGKKSPDELTKPWWCHNEGPHLLSSNFAAKTTRGDRKADLTTLSVEGCWLGLTKTEVIFWCETMTRNNLLLSSIQKFWLLCAVLQWMKFGASHKWTTNFNFEDLSFWSPMGSHWTPSTLISIKRSYWRSGFVIEWLRHALFGVTKERQIRASCNDWSQIQYFWIPYLAAHVNS